jgi:flagellin
VKALVAQDALNINARKMSKAMQQLSTGLRVNGAADDAAGLAISSRMTSQIRGLDQAVRNANDAMSLLETAEGAMVEVSDMMQRMRELAVQASSDSNSAADRAYLQQEFQALSDEIVRIRDTTTFNGMSLLNGDGNFTFQIGADAGQSMVVGIDDIAGASSGGTLFASANALTTAPTGTAGQESVVDIGAEDGTAEFKAGDKIFLTVGDVQIAYTITAADVIDIDATSTPDDGTGDAIATKLAAIINGNSKLRGVVNAEATINGDNTLTITGVDLNDPFAFSVSYSAEISLSTSTSAADGTDGQETVVDFADIHTNDYEFEAGDVIFANVRGTEIRYTVTADDVRDFDETSTPDDGTGSAIATKLAALINSTASLQGVVNASASVNADNTLTLTGTDLDETFTVEFSVRGESATGIAADISSQTGASSAISSLTSAIESLDSQRARIGASINRLTHTVDNLNNISSNTSASRSRIIDTDYAKASAELARSQIIQQAATAMLAQANQQPASVLSLLQ